MLVHLSMLLMLTVAAFEKDAERSGACKLIPEQEIEALQGEAVVAAKPTERSSGGFLFQQCFYTLKTFTNSISLQVTRSDPEQAEPSHPGVQWAELFHPDEKEKEKQKKKKRQSQPAQPVAGLGDEAFWTGDGYFGVLYVLKGDDYFRISVGGPQSESERRKKCETLARRVVERLDAPGPSLTR